MTKTTSKPIKRNGKAKLYFAYGANTNIAGMARRCPDARPIGRMRLNDHRLIFRGVADVEPVDGRHVSGALWWITPACEASLDRFEGYPYHYVKRRTKVVLHGEEQEVMFYVMRRNNGTSPPPDSYEFTLRHGYEAFGIPQDQIDKAIDEAVAEMEEAPFHKDSGWG